jgi:photoactive yellow protein
MAKQSMSVGPDSGPVRAPQRELLENQMSAVIELDFNQDGLGSKIAALSKAELDVLDFGVIGFDEDGIVRLYNEFESRMAGLSPKRVLGFSLFTVVAPCMNNFMVAQRFEDAATASGALDTTIDYVLTLRMRPVKVKLRLLASVGDKLRYVLVRRPS